MDDSPPGGVIPSACPFRHCVVTDLKSDALMIAFHLFLYKKGLPSDMYNGTNFAGADAELQKLQQIIKDECSIKYAIVGKGINGILSHLVHHTDGLWGGGAALKFMKRHLKRVAFNAKLTHEELLTLLC